MMSHLSIVSTCLLIFIGVEVQSQLDEVCRHPLGMEDKRINNQYITATSAHAYGTSAKFARLNRDEGDGAWCPLGNIQPSSESEYLQIRLPSLYFVTGVATQGRHDKGTGREWTRSYKVKYSREGSFWYTWRSTEGVQILSGNSDSTTVSRRSLTPGVAGVQFVRIVPVSNRPTPICLRVELYGCPWKSGLVSYDIPAPDDHSFWTSENTNQKQTMYSDDTYDGDKGPTLFFRGLGQLADGVIGGDDIKKTESRVQNAMMGYDYVGWSVGPSDNGRIDIIFRFDAVRNFTLFRLYSYVDQSIGASLFSIVRIHSSFDGVVFSPDPVVSFNAHMGAQDQGARVFNLQLRPPVIAKTLKFIFEVPQGRMLLSEVEFENKLVPPDVASRYIADPPWMEGGSIQEITEGKQDMVTHSPADNGSSGDNTGVIVGVLVGLVVILIIILAALFYRRKKLRKTLTPPVRTHYATNRSEPIVTLVPRMSSTTECDERKEPIYHRISSSADNEYQDPKDVLDRTPPPPYHSNTPNSSTTGSQLINEAPSEASHYAATNIFAEQIYTQPIQGVSGNNIYAVPWNSPSPKSKKRKGRKGDSLPKLQRSSKNADERKNLLKGIHSSDLPPEFPREKLQFIEKLGEGQFGEVHLCKADPSLRQLEDDGDFAIRGSPTSPVLVAVKVLREDASTNAKEDFLKEVRVMSRLLHGNIIRLIAVCTKDEPFAMVTEYMEHGDLNQYLQTFDSDIQPSPGKKVIKTETLIKMAVQIAGGMEYLSSLNFVHRDLATRNCLVGSDNEIRIGDFGMSRNMYQSDYYRIQGRAVLPIRWMSWECVLLGKFSSSSDVWAFGVTLWEIYSLCKYQPYTALNDQDVIQNLHEMYQRTGKETFLPRPKRCPASMYNMIRQCWKRDSEYRPNFAQLLSYLMERQQTNSPKPQRPRERPPVPTS